MVRKAKTGSTRKGVCQLLILKENITPVPRQVKHNTWQFHFFFFLHIKEERENISIPSFVLHLRTDYQTTGNAY